MDELRLRQREALAAVLKAEKELEQKQQETERSRRELEETEAIKARAAGEADFAAKSVAGDDYAAHLAEGLQRDGYAVVDNFLGEPVASYIREEMLMMQRDGLLKESELAGGKSGKNMRYTMASIRGDVVRFVDGTEDEGCYNIGLLKEFSDQIVIRVQERVDELKQQVIQRGKLMCTCYPGDINDEMPCGKGGPCRYVRHCDNPDKNGRRLTALYYLNKVCVCLCVLHDTHTHTHHTHTLSRSRVLSLSLTFSHKNTQGLGRARRLSPLYKKKRKNKIK